MDGTAELPAPRLRMDPNLRMNWSSLRSSFHRHVGALGDASIKLPRPADALRGIFDHLLPVRNPARRSRDRIEHGMQAYGLAPDDPARRTVAVEALCSWSA